MMKNKIRVFTLLVLICLISSCKPDNAANPQAANNQAAAPVTLANTATPDDLDLIAHTKQGDTRRVKSMFESGKGTIYSADENGETALMMAAQTKNIELADFIIDKISNGDKNALDRADNSGKTAMIYAAQNNADKIIRALRKKGSDPNTYDKEKNTPLFIATKANYLEASVATLENITGTIAANPDLGNSAGDTPVLAACANKNTELLKTLKTYNANFDLPNATGISPLAYAVSKNDKQLFDGLLSLGANINYMIGGQKTVLTYAIETGNNDFIKYILDKGGDPNIHDKVLPTPLQEIVSKEKTDPAIVEYLVTKGAKLNGQDMQGGNVISWAIHKGNAPAIEKLIAKGAKVSDLETANNSGVLMAANIGDPAIAALMIANGSDVGKPNEEGFSPLALAAKNNYQDLFVELIKKGADVNAVSRNKYATPLEIVFASSNSDLLKLMFDNGLKVSPDAILLRAITEKKNDLITVALAYGARANIMNSIGQPAIWLATAKDDTKAVQDLVDNSAMLDVQDTEKSISPLSLAILRNNDELANYLIEKGANPNLEDKNGYTSLTYAAVTGKANLVKTLMAHKALTNVTDLSGKSISELVDGAKIPKDRKDLVKSTLAGK